MQRQKLTRIVCGDTCFFSNWLFRKVHFYYTCRLLTVVKRVTIKDSKNNSKHQIYILFKMIIEWIDGYDYLSCFFRKFANIFSSEFPLAIYCCNCCNWIITCDTSSALKMYKFLWNAGISEFTLSLIFHLYANFSHLKVFFVRDVIIPNLLYYWHVLPLFCFCSHIIWEV